MFTVPIIKSTSITAAGIHRPVPISARNAALKRASVMPFSAAPGIEKINAAAASTASASERSVHTVPTASLAVMCCAGVTGSVNIRYPSSPSRFL